MECEDVMLGVQTCCGTISSNGGLDAYGCTALDVGWWLRGGCTLLWQMSLMDATFSDRELELGAGMGRL